MLLMTVGVIPTSRFKKIPYTSTEGIVLPESSFLFSIPLKQQKKHMIRSRFKKLL
jgi:hypothetical protein